MKNLPRSVVKARVKRLVRRGSYATALPLLRIAMAGTHPMPEHRFLLAQCHFELGDIHAAVGELRRAARTSDSQARLGALGRIAICIPGDPKVDNAGILRARRQWARLAARDETSRPRPPPPDRSPRRKLRIGYVSAFFTCHNWMKPVWGMLNAHDRRVFEVHLFLDRGIPWSRIRFVPHRSDRVHHIDGLSNEAAADLIAAAGIDILVDLNAYSYPSRFGVFFRKPARVQVLWFNLYSTSGIEAFDYLVADKSTIPAREEEFYTEGILRVRGSYLAFTVPYKAPSVVAPPCTRSGCITFGCLAPQYKITGEVVATFAEILRAAPGSRLILKNHSLGDAGNRTAIRARFLRHGISKNQLIFEGPARHFAFLKTYDRIDIALDSFPYNGGTTTMEALWQGVPVLTFRGDRWVARISSSLLKAAGLGEWVCPSRGSFARRAAALANSSDTAARLSALRRGMRKRLRASPACDAVGLCKQLEHHYGALARAASR
jgi:protein O-GlcNAc transferase